MLGDIPQAEKIYLACGYTDMRKASNGLAAIVQQNFKLNLFSNSLFLFCERNCSHLKALYWEEKGFVLLYKRLEYGRFQWPRSQEELRQISYQELRWLLEGLSIDQPKAVKKLFMALSFASLKRKTLWK
ncbi:IS66 family insertion sequence element accessory protein TnpB [Blautia coccoides]|uniref:IS66 family insertion sequence element accessory protein TnpB n=1 Tax=Blautia producta TaxID=33035 RepID=UPI00214A86F8|nr:IS66 family insertion sequence element accessory protein TnpB [Blautia coccoides]MCR1988421.1 IS66 family insertion sequence element accessory protein TnpB [Blautia coccoides]